MTLSQWRQAEAQELASDSLFEENQNFWSNEHGCFNALENKKES